MKKKSELGCILKEFRKANGMTQGQVVRGITGFDSSNLSRVENGATISLDSLRAVCENLSIPLSKLFLIEEGKFSVDYVARTSEEDKLIGLMKSLNNHQKDMIMSVLQQAVELNKLKNA